MLDMWFDGENRCYIPNGFEKYIAFMVNRNLIFIDSMQFMNSSLQSWSYFFLDILMFHQIFLSPQVK